jgi:ATP-dependent DNA helicase RecG
MLAGWENEARAEDVPTAVILAVTARLRDYHQLTPPSREEVLAGLWKRVMRSAGEPIPDLFGDAPEPPKPAPRADPPAAKPPRTETAPPKPASPARPAPPPRAAPPPAAESSPADEADAGDETDIPEEKPAPQDDLFDETEPDLPEEPFVPGRKDSSPRVYQPAAPVPEAQRAPLDAPLTVLQGVGAKTAERLEKLGLATLRDALHFYPRRYLDYTQMLPINRLLYGETVTIVGSVERAELRPTKGGRQIIEALVSDGTGALRLTWFNQPWLVKALKEAGSISISGTVDQYLGRLVMSSPDWEPVDNDFLHTGGIVPVYPLTEGITQKWLRVHMKEVLDYWAPRVQDPLPEAVRAAANLMPLGDALRQVHRPESWETLADAQHRLGFDEIFLLQLGVMQQRRQWTERAAVRFDAPLNWLAAQFARLPYTLTGAQRRAIDDIRTDLASGRPMNRLLQGDVGSGKTVVAALAVAMAAQAGAQSALMAPTSLLAEQHFQGLTHLLSSEEGGALLPEQVALLVGSTPEGEKAEIRRGLAEGRIRLVIGTHALIEPDVLFANLELIVIDEQHRFGVDQRAALRGKGDNPHLLVMTATPIPRSLALTVYGDLDLSVMDEMPPGRQEIGTYLLRPVERERAYSLIRREVENGRQAFMVFPLVEESEKSEAKAAVEEHARLQAEIFPKLSLGLLHGRLRPDEKEEVMTRFRARQHHVLVSTSVVEVGVDVPNATVMVIEGANRFGLAQLHQFRGRVGRGSEKSFCLLIPDKDDAAENDRLKAMTETNDGFVLAGKDLDQRGPGEFLGVRQSGYSELRMASLTDVRLIEKARAQAQAVFAADPDLAQPEHVPLRAGIAAFWGRGDVS